MSSKPDYKVYATLLDVFNDYVNSDEVWLRYWGQSPMPPHTMEEFHDIQFNNLISRINRMPFKSEAASKGTAFNELVDCLVEHRNTDKMEVEVIRNGFNQPIALNAQLDGFSFTFPYEQVKEFADYFKGAITQYLCKAPIETDNGVVELYGYIDELMPDCVHDIKTTGNYCYPKFKEHAQHLVYPYCLNESGDAKVNRFEYNILCWRNGQTYTEEYSYVPERDIPVLRQRVTDFTAFLNDNKDLITDKKIFAEENG